ncbi:MAG: hypothetical protein WCT85_03790 [Parachlamydiales bacterium]|jgi:hypothetical protein
MSTPIKNQSSIFAQNSPFDPYKQESKKKIEEEIIIIDSLKKKLFEDPSEVRPDTPDPIARIKQEGEHRSKSTLAKALNERKIISDLGAENNKSISVIRKLNRMKTEEKRLQCTLNDFNSSSIEKKKVSHHLTKVEKSKKK